MQKGVVILLGAPGAGKGTQAELLKEQRGLTFIETSKILEERYRNFKDGEYLEVEGEKFSIADEQHKWKTGLLNSFPFVTALLLDRFRQLAEEGKSLLLAGSPRSLYEAEREIPLLDKFYGKENIHVILLNITEEDTVFRNSHRRLCELLRHPILYTEETKDLTICPLDGSRLFRREGLDDPGSIKVRLNEYRQHTFPIIEYMRSYGLRINEVDGSKSVAEVHDAIQKVLPAR